MVSSTCTLLTNFTVVHCASDVVVVGYHVMVTVCGCAVDALSHVAMGDVEKQLGGRQWRSRTTKLSLMTQVARAARALADEGFHFAITVSQCVFISVRLWCLVV